MEKREVTASDWNNMDITFSGSKVYARALRRQPIALHLFWITELYKVYRLGDWNNQIPDPSTLQDKQELTGYNDDRCIFHRNHEKFGPNVVEGYTPYAEESFVFFDYESIAVVFDALDNDLPVPPIPTYYALVSDRYDVKNGETLW